ncbi:MAG: nitrilase-related carbon-nitrogen hydrolase [Rhodothermales bacterium]|nr:nitrilase-related carbon-nitrogen hydrolase [Rhodothermales bacterium]
MRISALQYDPVYLDVSRNLDSVEEIIESLQTDLLVLPEFFATGYFFRSTEDVRSVAEPIPNGPTADRLTAWADRIGGTIVAGLPELDGPTVYNSAVVVNNSGVIGKYRKVHLFYEEKLHFRPGDLGLPVFDVVNRDLSEYRLGLMICFDWYYPEAARTLALAGADVIAHPSNLVRKDCPRAMPIRALENHVFTVTANRTGREVRDDESLTFIGQSLICGPEGEVLGQLGPEESGLLHVEINPATAANRQITKHNDLFVDRRPDSYRLA